MSITENFLVNTKNFEAIIEELRTTGDLPDKVTSDFLEMHGYSNPSDLLVLHLFKDLEMLDDDGSPTPLFEEFRKEETSKKAMASGIVEAYSELFKSNPLVYKLQTDQLKDEFKKFFGSSKSDLILKYMANTFSTLINYAGTKNIEQASEKYLGDNDISGVEEVIREVAQKQNNGISQSASNKDEEVVVAEADADSEETINKEEKGETGIEDIIFAAPDSSTEDDTDDLPDAGDAEDVVEHTDSDPETEPETEDWAGEEENEAETENEFHEEADEEAASDETNEEEDSTSHSDPFGLNETNNSKDKTMQTANISSKEQKYVDKAFLKKAELLYKLDKFEEALPAFKKVIDRYGDAEDPLFKDHVSKAVIHRASILDEMERYEEALPAYHDVFERFENSSRPEYYNHASNALVKKIEIMERLDLEQDRLLPVYSKVIDRLGNSENSQYKKQVDKAYVKQADILVETGDNPEKALNAVEAVIDRFTEYDGDDNGSLEKAMFLKAELLEQLGKNEEALQAYETFLSTFGNDDE